MITWEHRERDGQRPIWQVLEMRTMLRPGPWWSGKEGSRRALVYEVRDGITETQGVTVAVMWRRGMMKGSLERKAKRQVRKCCSLSLEQMVGEKE